jgi:hypothetical protein
MLYTEADGQWAVRTKAPPARRTSGPIRRRGASLAALAALAGGPDLRPFCGGRAASAVALVGRETASSGDDEIGFRAVLVRYAPPGTPACVGSACVVGAFFDWSNGTRTRDLGNRGGGTATTSIAPARGGHALVVYPLRSQIDGPAVARIASYNVENLFARPKVFRTADWTVGEPKLAAYDLQEGRLLTAGQGQDEEPVGRAGHLLRQRARGSTPERDVVAAMGLASKEPGRLRPTAGGQDERRRDHRGLAGTTGSDGSNWRRRRSTRPARG